MPKISRRSDRYNIHTTVREGNVSVKKRKTVNFLAKILSALAAFGIWFYAASTDTAMADVVFTVPVTIENESVLEENNDWSVIAGKNNYVEVTLRGKKNSISKLTEDQIEAYADVGSVTSAGRHHLDVFVSHPGEYTLADKSVNSITVYVDKKTSVTVPVKVKLAEYVLDANCNIDEPLPDVREVVITGPSSEVDKIEYALVTLNPGVLKQSVTASGNLVPVDANGSEVIGSYISMKTTSVTVKINVYTDKEIPLKVSYKYGYYNDSNVRIKINPESVTVRGDPAVLAGIDAIELTQLDEKNISGENTITSYITVPKEVTKISEVEMATVSVEHVGTGLRKLAVTKFTFTNPNRIEYTLMQESLILTLRGTLDALSSADSELVTVNVDLTNITGTGIMLIPVRIIFSPPDTKDLYEIGEYRVQVRVD